MRLVGLLKPAWHMVTTQPVCWDEGMRYIATSWNSGIEMIVQGFPDLQSSFSLANTPIGGLAEEIWM